MEGGTFARDHQPFRYRLCRSIQQENLGKKKLGKNGGDFVGKVGWDFGVGFLLLRLRNLWYGIPWFK